MNVLHSNFLALVGDRCSRQKQVQHVQDIYEATAVLCGNSLLVVASQLKQIKKNSGHDSSSSTDETILCAVPIKLSLNFMCVYFGKRLL